MSVPGIDEFNQLSWTSCFLLLKVDFNEYRITYNRFPIVLQPAFELQDAMQRHTLGEKEWVRIMEGLAWNEKVRAYRGPLPAITH